MSIQIFAQISETTEKKRAMNFVRFYATRMKAKI